MRGTPWTPAQVEILKALWGKDFSASEIAHKLGDKTRNAVIGKAHRLFLAGRPSPIKARSKAKPKPSKAVLIPRSIRRRNDPEDLDTFLNADFLSPALNAKMREGME